MLAICLCGVILRASETLAPTDEDAIGRGHYGFLLNANVDALFDRKLVTYDAMHIHPHIPEITR